MTSILILYSHTCFTGSRSLSFWKHINGITKTGYFHWRNIATIYPGLSLSDAETLVHAFVSTRLDYCSALFSGLPKSTLTKLHNVQNTAAGILTKTRKSDHITPALISPRWLPIHARSSLQDSALAYKILHSLAPSDSTSLVPLYAPMRTLRSGIPGLLTIPKINKKSVDSRAFSY